MDAALIAFIGGYIYAGWRTGFLRRLIGLGFMAASFVLGAYLRYPFGAIATTFFKGIPASYGELVGYTIAFPAILAAAHIATRPLLKNVAVTGVSKEVDKGLGAVFGGVEAVLIVSAAIVILDTYFGTKTTVGSFAGLGALRDLSTSLNASETAHLLRDSTVPLTLTVLGPILPKEIASLASHALPTGLPTGLPGGLPFLSPKP